MHIPLLVAFLFGCQPRTWEICYSNDQLVNDICDYDLDNDQEQQVLNSCSYNSGFYQKEGCANAANAYQKCIQAVLLTDPDCDEYQTDIADNCSELGGKLDGCLADD